MRPPVRLSVVLMLAVSQASAQTVRGRVTAEEDGAVLAGATISLLTASNEVVTRVETDLRGGYVLDAPNAGAYRVVADHLGYLRLESPLAALEAGRVIAVDFELPPDPVELEGLRVEVERNELLRDRVRQYGVRLDQLGRRYVTQADIERRIWYLSFGGVLQWQAIPGIVVDVGPPTNPTVCVRSTRHPRSPCAVTVLDGAVVTPEAAASIPLDALGAIVVLTPMEATLSFGTGASNGAVLLFTRAGLATR